MRLSESASPQVAFACNRAVRTRLNEIEADLIREITPFDELQTCRAEPFAYACHAGM
jgi:hypothetical protein